MSLVYFGSGGDKDLVFLSSKPLYAPRTPPNQLLLKVLSELKNRPLGAILRRFYRRADCESKRYMFHVEHERIPICQFPNQKES